MNSNARMENALTQANEVMENWIVTISAMKQLRVSSDH